MSSLMAEMASDAATTSGGAHTSRTMMLTELRQLLSACPADAELSDYEVATKEDNVLGKSSSASRQRTFRYLRELYALDLAEPSFRSLRRLWDRDTEAQPLIALASALTRDPAFRGTASAVLRASEGDTVTADALAQAVMDTYPGNYSQAVAHKIGRNAASTWTQSGHLSGRMNKIRVRAHARPASVAYALYLASLEGLEGDLLFESLVVQAQDAPTYSLKDLARAASQRSWLDFRSIGSVTELGFAFLESEGANA